MTLETKIAELKLQYPTIKTGSDNFYTVLNATEYDSTITKWAQSILADEATVAAKVTAEATYAKDRADGLAKLELAGLTIAQAEAVARKKL